jgi:hypothetical protein
MQRSGTEHVAASAVAHQLRRRQTQALSDEGVDDAEGSLVRLPHRKHTLDNIEGVRGTDILGAGIVTVTGSGGRVGPG